MLLLDTHILLWFLSDDPKLPANVKEMIETSRSVSVSVGTFWEIAIKDSIGKLKLPAPVAALMAGCEEIGFVILPIKAAHLAMLKELPKIHGDPFDRLFVCQAMSEDMTLVTADSNIVKYGVKTCWGAESAKES